MGTATDLDDKLLVIELNSVKSNEPALQLLEDIASERLINVYEVTIDVQRFSCNRRSRVVVIGVTELSLRSFVLFFSLVFPDRHLSPPPPPLFICDVFLSLLFVCHLESPLPV